VRAQAHVGILAALATSYLPEVDADAIVRLLRSGRHDRAAEQFGGCFSERYFPLACPPRFGGGPPALVEVTAGIQFEGYGETWEEYGDLWALKPVFLLSWALMEDPYGALRDEFARDEADPEQASPDRLCDQARDAVAEIADRRVDELFADVPIDGFPSAYLRPRFSGTHWEPLLWAAPWLWRLSGNLFLDRTDDDYDEPEPWTQDRVFRLAAEYREAIRIMDAVHAFDTWLCEAPAERARAAVQAALGPASDRIPSLLDLPVIGGCAGCSHSPLAAAS